MNQSLSRRQLAALGLAVLLALGGGAAGLAALAVKQGVGEEHAEFVVAFPEVHDIGPGTPVRLRGVEAGQVVGVDYPDDPAEAAVCVRLRVPKRLASHLRADASAQIHATSLLGQKVVALSPGSPGAGPLIGNALAASAAPDLGAAAAKLAAAADEAALLVKEVRTGDGTVGKLMRDDELYRDLRALAGETRGFLRRADDAVGTVEREAGQVKALVGDGRETLRSVRQGTDALQKLPIVRGYVEDPIALLVRPEARRQVRTYAAGDLFEPATAILTAGGREHLAAAAKWLLEEGNLAGDLVVVAGDKGGESGESLAAGVERTRKQGEAVLECLRAAGAHKIGWVTRRKMAAVGLGAEGPPVPLSAAPPAFVQLALFTGR